MAVGWRDRQYILWPCIIHLFLLLEWMRRKTQVIEKMKEDDGYELEGWTNDADDLLGNNNLLKILEKKITFPLLDNENKGRKRLSKKLETLPAVIENPKVKFDLPKGHKTHDVHLSPIMKVQKNRKMETEGTEKMIAAKMKKNKTQKIKLCAIQNTNSKEASEPVSNFTLKKQKNKSVKNFNRSYLQFFQSIKDIQENKAPLKLNNDIKKSKHHKMASVQSFPMKAKLAIFQQKLPVKKDDEKQHGLEKKIIRWDRFNISHDRTAINFHKIKETTHATPQNTNSKEKESKSREPSHHKTNSSNNQNWLEKMLHKTKTQKFLHPQTKILRTESKNYFLDEHLQSQSPFSETRQQRFY